MAGHPTAVCPYDARFRPAELAASHIVDKLKLFGTQALGQHDGEPISMGPITSYDVSCVFPYDDVLKNVFRV